MSRRFGTKPDDDVYADAAGYLCLHEAELREAVGEQCWATSVPVITTAEPSSTPWREAIRAVHDAAQAAGIPGGLGLQHSMGDGFPPPPAPRSSGWVCPGGSCSRVVLREASGAPSPDPVCTLAGQPMRLVE